MPLCGGIKATGEKRGNLSAEWGSGNVRSSAADEATGSAAQGGGWAVDVDTDSVIELAGCAEREGGRRWTQIHPDDGD